MDYQLKLSDLPDDQPSSSPPPSGDSPVVNNSSSNYQLKLSDLPDESKISDTSNVQKTQTPLSSIGNYALQSVLGAGQNTGNFLGGIGSGYYNSLVRPAIQTAESFLPMPSGNSPQMTGSGLSTNIRVMPNSRDNLPQAPDFPGASGTAGKLTGDTLGFIGGGDILDAVRGGVAAAEQIPSWLSKGAQWLGKDSLASNIARNASGTAAYSTLNNPDDKTSNAETGGIVGALAGTIPTVGRGISKVADALNADKYVQMSKDYATNLISKISGGKNVVDSAKDVQQSVNQNYWDRVRPIAQGFNEIAGKVGGDSIYGRTPSSIQSFKTPDDAIDFMNDTHGTNIEDTDDLHKFMQDQYGYGFKNDNDLLKFFNSSPSASGQSYLKIAPQISNNLTSSLKNLNNQFIQNPTYDNGRQLYSQYAQEVARISSKSPGDISSLENDQKHDFQNGMFSLDNDLQGFLKGNDPALQDKYNGLKEAWRNEVIPYRNSGSSQLLGADPLSPNKPYEYGNQPVIPANIHTLFGSKSGIPSASDMKVYQDLSPDIKNKILFSAMGNQTATKTPDSLLKSYDSLADKGINDLKTPEISSDFEGLRGNIQNRDEGIQKVAKRVDTLNALGGGLAGAALSHAAGGGGGLSTLGGIFGSAFGHQMLPRIYNSDMLKSSSNYLGNRGINPSLLSKLIMANTLPSNQNNP